MTSWLGQAERTVPAGIRAAASRLAGGGGLDALTGGAIANFGYQYNRELHKDERQRIREIAQKRRAELGYGSADEAYAALEAVACSMVHCAAQIPVEQQASSPEHREELADGELRNERPDLEAALSGGAGTFVDARGQQRVMFSYTTAVDGPGSDEWRDSRGAYGRFRPAPSPAAIQQRNLKLLEDYSLQLHLRSYTLFNGGETGAFGVPYQNAYESLASSEARINALPEVIDWVRNQSVAGNQLTLEQIDVKATEYAQTQALFNGWVYPWFYTGLGAVSSTGQAGRATSSGPAEPEPSTMSVDPILRDPRHSGVGGVGEASAGGPARIYSARELMRRAAEPGPFHNFPESFNEPIFGQCTRTVTPELPEDPEDGAQQRLGDVKAPG